MRAVALRSLLLAEERGRITVVAGGEDVTEQERGNVAADRHTDRDGEQEEHDENGPHAEEG